MKEFVITNDFHIKVSLSLKLLVSILLQNDLLLTTWNTYRVSFWPGGINYQLRKKTDTTETLVTFPPLNFARKRYWTNYSFDGLNRPFVEFTVISLLWSFNLVLSFATLLLILGSIFFFFFFFSICIKLTYQNTFVSIRESLSPSTIYKIEKIENPLYSQL